MCTVSNVEIVYAIDGSYPTIVLRAARPYPGGVGRGASVSDAEFLLPSLFRFCCQRESTGQGIEDFRVPERPGIINRYSIEAPLVAIAH
jgi:hypothetical protein